MKTQRPTAALAFLDLIAPTKQKILFDLFLAVALLITAVAVPSLGFQNYLLSTDFTHQIIHIVAGTIVAMLAYYPMTCGLSYFYRVARGHKPPTVPKLTVAFILLVVCNPVSYSLFHYLLTPRV